MSYIAIDTSVVLRLLINEPEKQAWIAKNKNNYSSLQDKLCRRFLDRIYLINVIF